MTPLSPVGMSCCADRFEASERILPVVQIVVGVDRRLEELPARL